jgi:hypothetical protein
LSITIIETPSQRAEYAAALAKFAASFETVVVKICACAVRARHGSQKARRELGSGMESRAMFLHGTKRKL